jgi:hypothetical protein
MVASVFLTTLALKVPVVTLLVMVAVQFKCLLCLALNLMALCIPPERVVVSRLTALPQTTVEVVVALVVQFGYKLLT